MERYCKYADIDLATQSIPPASPCTSLSPDYNTTMSRNSVQSLFIVPATPCLRFFFLLKCSPKASGSFMQLLLTQYIAHRIVSVRPTSAIFSSRSRPGLATLRYFRLPSNPPRHAFPGAQGCTDASPRLGVWQELPRRPWHCQSYATDWVRSPVSTDSKRHSSLSRQRPYCRRSAIRGRHRQPERRKVQSHTKHH